MSEGVCSFFCESQKILALIMDDSDDQEDQADNHTEKDKPDIQSSLCDNV